MTGPDAGATRFARIRAQLEAAQPTSGWQGALYEFLLFGFKQGWACLFGGLMLALLMATHLFYPTNAPLARYDFLTIGAGAKCSTDRPVTSPGFSSRNSLNRR